MHDQELEFTIEPFVEGRPGLHVRSAVEAVEALGVAVEFGPFGSACRASSDTMPSVVAAIVEKAFANGATHVSMHVSHHTPSTGVADGVDPPAERTGDDPEAPGQMGLS